MSEQCPYCRGPRSPEHDRTCMGWMNRNEWMFWLLGIVIAVLWLAYWIRP